MPAELIVEKLSSSKETLLLIIRPCLPPALTALKIQLHVLVKTQFGSCLVFLTGVFLGSTRTGVRAGAGLGCRSTGSFSTGVAVASGVGETYPGVGVIVGLGVADTTTEFASTVRVAIGEARFAVFIFVFEADELFIKKAIAAKIAIAQPNNITSATGTIQANFLYTLGCRFETFFSTDGGGSIF